MYPLYVWLNNLNLQRFFLFCIQHSTSFSDVQWSLDNKTTIGTLDFKRALNSGQVSLTLMRHIYIEECNFVLKQVVSIVRVVIILSGLNNGT